MARTSPPSIRTTTQQNSVSADASSGGCGDRPSGRVEHAAMRAWLAAAGGSGRTASAEASRTSRHSLADSARFTGLYPRHTAACVDSSEETRVAISGIACDARRWQRGWPSGWPTEQASAGSTVSADAASAVFVSVRRRHDLPQEVRASAGSSQGSGRQRQEGNDRSDAERLSTRGMLRRVRTALRGTMQGCSTGWSVDLRVCEANGTRAGIGKRSEPCPDRAATCPNPQSGANRRGGESPRGRNVMCSGWSRHTEGRWQHRSGVDAPGS